MRHRRRLETIQKQKSDVEQMTVQPLEEFVWIDHVESTDHLLSHATRLLEHFADVDSEVVSPENKQLYFH